MSILVCISTSINLRWTHEFSKASGATELEGQLKMSLSLQLESMTMQELLKDHPELSTKVSTQLTRQSKSPR